MVVIVSQFTRCRHFDVAVVIEPTDVVCVPVRSAIHVCTSSSSQPDVDHGNFKCFSCCVDFALGSVFFRFCHSFPVFIFV